MRRNELTIVLSLVVIGVIAAFWMVALSPKRERAASLEQEVAALHSQLDQAQQATVAGEQQRKSFPADYRRLVVLGKAVPEDGDQPGLLVQLQQLADQAKVRFQSLELSASTGSAPPTAPPTPTGTTETTSDSASASSASSEPVPDTAPATEASAATLPIGASVGPAGLPVMGYQLKFTGDFFAIADFLEGLDALVHVRQGAINVHGRLVTVDGFALQPSDTGGAEGTGEVSVIPTLTAEVSVTSYLTPDDQGLTAGAGPTGPEAAATPTPASTPIPAESSTPTVSPSP